MGREVDEVARLTRGPRGARSNRPGTAAGPGRAGPGRTNDEQSQTASRPGKSWPGKPARVRRGSRQYAHTTRLNEIYTLVCRGPSLATPSPRNLKFEPIEPGKGTRREASGQEAVPRSRHGSRPCTHSTRLNETCTLVYRGLNLATPKSINLKSS